MTLKNIIQILKGKRILFLIIFSNITISLKIGCKLKFGEESLTVNTIRLFDIYCCAVVSCLRKYDPHPFDSCLGVMCGGDAKQNDRFIDSPISRVIIMSESSYFRLYFSLKLFKSIKPRFTTIHNIYFDDKIKK